MHAYCVGLTVDLTFNRTLIGNNLCHMGGSRKNGRGRGCSRL